MYAQRDREIERFTLDKPVYKDCLLSAIVVDPSRRHRFRASDTQKSSAVDVCVLCDDDAAAVMLTYRGGSGNYREIYSICHRRTGVWRAAFDEYSFGFNVE